MEVSKGSIFLIGGLFMFAVAFSVFVSAADPQAPTSFQEGLTTRLDPGNYGPLSHDASAGNITALVIEAIGQTRAWQGYYGNVTATVTLDDANNFTFYNWTSAEPRGQIYASLSSSPTWDSVFCYDFAKTNMNWDDIEGYYNIDYDDVDGVNETYDTTGHPDFQVSSRTMSGCPTTYIYQNDAAQTSNFVNVLLHDEADNTSGWIYTTLIENKSNATGSPADLVCYNNEICDFQILVNEDGHDTDTSPTTYYFWVELN